MILLIDSQGGRLCVFPEAGEEDRARRLVGILEFWKGWAMDSVTCMQIEAQVHLLMPDVEVVRSVRELAVRLTKNK